MISTSLKNYALTATKALNFIPPFEIVVSQRNNLVIDLGTLVIDQRNLYPYHSDQQGQQKATAAERGNNR